MTALLSAEEAARRLGVKRQTLYAYVSRGLLASRRVDGHRGSVFALDDVEALARRGRAGRSPAGAVETIRTAITAIEDDRLAYRGQDVVARAGEVTFEATADLLWTGEWGSGSWSHPDPELVECMAHVDAALPRGARLAERIRVAVAVAAASDPLQADLTPAVVVTAARRLLTAIPTALSAARHEAGSGGASGVAARLWPALTDLPPAPASVAVLDTALVLLADHGLAVSTVAARVAASARADVYGVLSAGLGAADGHVHAGAATLAHRFLAEAMTDPAGAVADRLRSGLDVPGFGHRLYREQDPRAEALLSMLPDGPARRAADAVCAALVQRPGSFPTVDLALAAMAHGFGMRRDAAEAVFAFARMSGWVAHALEEYAEPELRFRPVGMYTGGPRRAHPRGAA